MNTVKKKNNCNEVGMLRKTSSIKTEYNDLQILFNLNSIEYTTKTRYLMFKLINFIGFCADISLILNRMSATKVWESSGELKKHLFGTFHR